MSNFNVHSCYPFLGNVAKILAMSNIFQKPQYLSCIRIFLNLYFYCNKNIRLHLFLTFRSLIPLYLCSIDDGMNSKLCIVAYDNKYQSCYLLRKILKHNIVPSICILYYKAAYYHANLLLKQGKYVVTVKECRYDMRTFCTISYSSNSGCDYSLC